MRRITALIMSALVLGGSLTEAVAQSRTPDLSRAYPGEGYTQYRERVIVREYYGRPSRYDRYDRYDREYDRHRHGHRHYRRDRGGDAAAVALGAGLIGALAIGAAASAAQAQPALPRPPATQDPQLAAWCAKRYRSFDAVTGTFVGASGQRLVCTY